MILNQKLEVAAHKVKDFFDTFALLTPNSQIFLNSLYKTSIDEKTTHIGSALAFCDILPSLAPDPFVFNSALLHFRTPGNLHPRCQYHTRVDKFNAKAALFFLKPAFCRNAVATAFLYLRPRKRRTIGDLDFEQSEKSSSLMLPLSFQRLSLEPIRSDSFKITKINTDVTLFQGAGKVCYLLLLQNNLIDLRQHFLLHLHSS